MFHLSLLKRPLRHQTRSKSHLPVPQLSSPTPDYSYHLALACIEVGEYVSAKQHLNSVISVCADYAEAYSQRGWICAQLGDVSVAISDYDRALELSGFESAEPSDGDLENWLRQLSAIATTNSFALSDRCQALRAQLEAAQLFYARGTARRALGNLEGALRDCNRAIRLDPHFAAAYDRCGVICYELGDYPTAIARYDRAIALAPSAVDAYFNRGLAVAAMGQYAAAIANYQHALALDPECGEAYVQIAAAQVQLKDWAAVAAACDRALAADPDSASAYLYRGIACHETDDLDAAIADYDRALARNPELYAAHHNRDLAVHSREAARLRTPPDIDSKAVAARAYIQRGLESIRLGNVRGAIRDFNSALDIAPDSPEALYSRGLAHDRLDEREAALADFNQAIVLCPEDREVREQLERARRKLVADKFGFGCVQHPVTKKWQIWFALDGRYVTCVFASRDRAQVEAVCRTFTDVLDVPETDIARHIVHLIRELETLDGSLPVDPLPPSCTNVLQPQMRAAIASS